jgi:hypothetical protein
MHKKLLLGVTVLLLANNITIASQQSFLKTALSYAKPIGMGGIIGGIFAALISDKSTNEKIATPFISGTIGVGLGFMITAITPRAVIQEIMPEKYKIDGGFERDYLTNRVKAYRHGLRSGMSIVLASALACGTITYSVLSK